MTPTGRLLVYRNSDGAAIAAVTSMEALGAVLRLYAWPHTGLHVAREGVPLSVTSMEAMVDQLDELGIRSRQLPPEPAVRYPPPLSTDAVATLRAAAILGGTS